MRLNDFSGIPIPDNAAVDTMLASMRSNMVTLRGGVIDMDGGQSYPETQQFGRQGWFTENIDVQIDTLRQRMRAGAGILRAKMRDNSKRITLAKISQLVTNADVNNYDCWQPYTIRFQQTYPYWLSEQDGWFLDSGVLLDTGLSFDWAAQTASISANPTSFTINNLGDAPVPMLFIHVICGATATLKNFTLVNDTNGMAFHYNQTLGNNTLLIVDTLGRVITNNSDPAYDGFGLEDPQQTNWMQLEVGANAFRLLYESKTNTPTIEFRFLRHYQ